MAAEVLSIQPGELKFPCKCLQGRYFYAKIDFQGDVLYNVWRFLFTVELRKQISCSVQLINTTQSYVAFKVHSVFSNIDSEIICLNV